MRHPQGAPPCQTPVYIHIDFNQQICTLLFQCYVLWHNYLFYILVDRAGAAAVTLLTKEIPLRLLVEKKADVTMDSKGCRNQNFNNPVTHHGACRIERNATVHYKIAYKVG